MKKILILCTGNSCRSQMAEGVLRSLDRSLSVRSAGTKPASKVHSMAVRVMSEAGIDISAARPKRVDEFIGMDFDFVITVCGAAREACPVFEGNVGKTLHMGFPDPALEEGTGEEVLEVFRSLRDGIIAAFTEFYEDNLKTLEQGGIHHE